MALLERVTTLIKANINDLVSKAEHPEKLLKQLLLDMENQLMQVKTQVAIAIADQHLLEKKQKDNLAHQQDWVRKAELALQKGDEPLARMALERSLTFETAAQNFSQQIEDQVSPGGDAQNGSAPAGAEDGGNAVENRSADRASPPGKAVGARRDRSAGRVHARCCVCADARQSAGGRSNRRRPFGARRGKSREETRAVGKSRQGGKAACESKGSASIKE